jgi:hypothetical protein
MSDGIRNLPTWAKFVIALLVVAFLGANVLIGVYIWALKTVWKNDPASVKSSVEKMISFESALSSDYSYKTAFDADFAPVKFAVIIHKPDNLEIVLLQISGNDAGLTPQRVITEHRRGNGKPVFIENGTKQIAGESMTYSIAKSNAVVDADIHSGTPWTQKDAAGQTPKSVDDAHLEQELNMDAPMFAGTVLVAKPKPHYFVCAVSPLSGANLDTDQVDAFLKNITKIY